jgi:hypothetical protein
MNAAEARLEARPPDSPPCLKSLPLNLVAVCGGGLSAAQRPHLAVASVHDWPSPETAASLYGARLQLR